MDTLFDKILNQPELGIFGLLFLYTFYLLRKDASEHRGEYKEIAEKLMTIVEANTVANTKLNESIETLIRNVAEDSKERVKENLYKFKT